MLHKYKKNFQFLEKRDYESFHSHLCMALWLIVGIIFTWYLRSHEKSLSLYKHLKESQSRVESKSYYCIYMLWGKKVQDG